MIKPKRKVSIFSMYKMQFLVIAFLLSSIIMSFCIMYYTGSKLAFGNLIGVTLLYSIPTMLFIYIICYFAHPAFIYLKELPRIIIARDKISRIPLTREELVYLNINSLEEYFEYIQENIKSTCKLFDEDCTLALNDYIFLTKEQEYCFQIFTKSLMNDAYNGKFNFYKENSKFVSNDAKNMLNYTRLKFNLVTNSTYDYEHATIFRNVFVSMYDCRTVEIVIKKYNSK